MTVCEASKRTREKRTFLPQLRLDHATKMLSILDRNVFDADEGAVRWNGGVYKEVVAFNAVASSECALRTRRFTEYKCSQTMPNVRRAYAMLWQ